MSLFMDFVKAIRGAGHSSSSVQGERTKSTAELLMTAFRAVKGMMFGSSKPSNDVPKSDSLSQFYTQMVQDTISKDFSKDELDLSGDGTAIKNFGELGFSNLPPELKNLTFEKFIKMTESQLKDLSDSTNIHFKTLVLLQEIFKATFSKKSVSQDVFHLLWDINKNIGNRKRSLKVDGKYIGLFEPYITKLNDKIDEIMQQAECEIEKSTQAVLAQFLPSEEQQAISKALSAQIKGNAFNKEERFDSNLELAGLDDSLKKFLDEIRGFVNIKGDPITEKHQGLIEDVYFDLLNKLKNDIRKNPSKFLQIIQQFNDDIKLILNLGKTNQATYNSKQPKFLATNPFKPDSRMRRFAALMSLVVVSKELPGSDRSVSSAGSSPRSGSSSSSSRNDASTKSSLYEWGDALQGTVHDSKDLSLQIKEQLDQRRAEKKEMKEADLEKAQEERDRKREIYKKQAAARAAAARASEQSSGDMFTKIGNGVEISSKPVGAFIGAVYGATSSLVEQAARSVVDGAGKALAKTPSGGRSEDEMDKEEERQERLAAAKFAKELKRQAQSSGYASDLLNDPEKYEEVKAQYIKIEGQIRQLYNSMKGNTDHVDQEFKELIDKYLNQFTVPPQDRKLFKQLFLME